MNDAGQNGRERTPPHTIQFINHDVKLTLYFFMFKYYTSYSLVLVILLFKQHVLYRYLKHGFKNNFVFKPKPEMIFLCLFVVGFYFFIIFYFLLNDLSNVTPQL